MGGCKLHKIPSFCQQHSWITTNIQLPLTCTYMYCNILKHSFAAVAVCSRHCYLINYYYALHTTALAEHEHMFISKYWHVLMLVSVCCIAVFSKLSSAVQNVNDVSCIFIKKIISRRILGRMFIHVICKYVIYNLFMLLTAENWFGKNFVGFIMFYRISICTQTSVR